MNSSTMRRKLGIFNSIKMRSVYFVLIALGLVFIVYRVYESNLPTIPKLSHEQAELIGNKIWQNEGAGKIENLVVWNKHEDFPSLGIGHFIWFPKDIHAPFEESFPQLLAIIRQKHQIPEWLKNSPDAPWQTRESFLRQQDSVQMNELRTLMLDSIALQTEFIILRMEAALPKILNAVSEPTKKAHIKKQFYRVADSDNGLYALIDYVNFKGEGVSEKERYNNQGWGLLQVLEQMSTDNENVMQEFANAADYVLTRRVNNAPRDESHWLAGWRKRLETYTQPLTHTGKPNNA